MFLAASAAKLLDPVGFREALDTWWMFSPDVESAFVWAVPVIEATVAAWWASGRRQFACMACAAGLLVLFTAAYALAAALHGPPRCGCLGAARLVAQWESSVAWTIVRNGVLLAMACLTRAFMPRRVTRTVGNCGAAVVGQPSPASAVVRGFSLVEMLVSIAVIGVLLGLSVTSLSRARASARGTRTLADLRTHCQAFGAYCRDWQETFPNPYPRLVPSSSVTPARGLRPFLVHCTWPYVLATPYYGLQPSSEVFRPSGYPAGLMGQPPTDQTPYVYSCSFLADPIFWNEFTRTGPEQWRGVREQEVLFPAGKALLTNTYAWMLAGQQAGGYAPGDARLESGFADGSVAAMHARDVPDGYWHGEGDWFDQGAIHNRPFAPTTHTIDGVRGYDRR